MAPADLPRDLLPREGKRIPHDPASVRRILVCQLNQLGDVLLATPSLEILARAYPRAEIHLFTEKKCLPLLEGNPHVHTVWALDKAALPTLLHELAFYRRIGACRFDLLVNFQHLPRCRWVTAFSGAKIRLAPETSWYNRWLYTCLVRQKPAYAAAFKAQILAPLGIAWQGERPGIYLAEQERAEARRLLAGFGLRGVFADKPDLRLITVDATHRHPTRQWPGEYYAALLDAAADLLPDLRFLLPWGPGEEAHVLSIQAACARPERVIIPGTLLSLRHMAACMEHAVLHLGNCSAPRHMAVALGVPSLTILGATSTAWTFPSPEHTQTRARDFLNMPCQHCNRNSCPHALRCLTRLTPDLVLPVLLKHLETHCRRNDFSPEDLSRSRMPPP
ncbi:MAG: glycosyltransferase family 9 protein [Desulfovibrio sp.]|jgi:heptosyltransferase-2/heptosyltransferase-3|nr:glycosyltransferase family 9 protein [Desulfovibrio sp.]